MSCQDPTQVERALFGPGGPRDASVFAVLDLARDSSIQPLLDQHPGRFCCLENAPLRPAVRRVSPYLLRLRPGQADLRALLERGWGASWGIFVVVPGTIAMEAVRRHFHALLRVRDESGRRYVFRFYDPRVARAFLPTCREEQLPEVFGPVREFWMESETGDALLGFTRERGAISRHDVAISAEGAA